MQYRVGTVLRYSTEVDTVLSSYSTEVYTGLDYFQDLLALALLLEGCIYGHHAHL